MSTDIISTSPYIMSGEPVFTGTRVPVQSLIDSLEAGESTVSRERVIAFLEEAKNRLIAVSK